MWNGGKGKGLGHKPGFAPLSQAAYSGSSLSILNLNLAFHY